MNIHVFITHNSALFRQKMLKDRFVLVLVLFVRAWFFPCKIIWRPCNSQLSDKMMEGVSAQSHKEALFESLSAVLSPDHATRVKGEEQVKALEVTEGKYVLFLSVSLIIAQYISTRCFQSVADAKIFHYHLFASALKCMYFCV